MAELTEVRRAKAAHQRSLLAKPNVIGVGAGYKISNGVNTGELCLVTLVRLKMPVAGLDPKALVPRQLDGIRTDVVEIGDVRALLARTDRWRPAPGGVSIGHYKITAGTFGAVVRDRTTGQRLILSNNHVLANSNDAAEGDEIIQPGAADGGQIGQDTIGHLERFCPIQFTEAPGSCNIASAYAAVGNAIAEVLGSSHRVISIQANPQATNLVDCAVARPTDATSILDEILDVGAITGTTAVSLGMQIRKSGRTTAFTTGQVSVIDATVNVSYGPGRTAQFDNQIVAGPMSQGGDSGSLVVAGNTQEAVGLLFAGSDQSTIINPIQAVLDCLNVTF